MIPTYQSSCQYNFRSKIRRSLHSADSSLAKAACGYLRRKLPQRQQRICSVFALNNNVIVVKTGDHICTEAMLGKLGLERGRQADRIQTGMDRQGYSLEH